MLKRYWLPVVASLLLPGHAVAFDLNGALGQVGNALEEMKKGNAQSSESNPANAALPAVPGTGEQSSQAPSKANEDYDRWKAEQKRKEEEDRRRLEAEKQQGNDFFAEERRKEQEEAEQRRKAEEERLRQSQEDSRRWEEEQDKRLKEAELQRQAEADQQARELEMKAQADGRARGLIPAPFGQAWGNTNFDSSKVVNQERKQNVETFAYMAENVPANTSELSFLVCNGSGLQKVVWQSARYDAWTVGSQHKKMKALLTDKYGSPTIDDGLARIYWAGASGTGVVLVANQYSNQNINLQVIYDGPGLEACIKKYNGANAAGF